MQKHILIILFFNFLIFSCNNSTKVKKSEILNDNEFIGILIDIHKADGIIISSDLQNKYRKKDSISLYNFVLKEHNVSRLKFSNTVKYYSLHIEEYNIFYDSVNNYFTNLQDELKKEIEKEKQEKEREKLEDSTNLWKLKDSWELPDDGKINPISFKVKAKEHGTYTLSASIRIFQDDKSVNQRMTIMANYEDGSKDLNTAGSMIKDGKFENYKVSINTNKNKILKSISGWVLDHSKGTEKKHVSVKKIKLKFFKDAKTNK